MMAIIVDRVVIALLAVVALVAASSTMDSRVEGMMSRVDMEEFAATPVRHVSSFVEVDDGSCVLLETSATTTATSKPSAKSAGLSRAALKKQLKMELKKELKSELKKELAGGLLKSKLKKKLEKKAAQKEAKRERKLMEKKQTIKKAVSKAAKKAAMAVAKGKHGSGKKGRKTKKGKKGRKGRGHKGKKGRGHKGKKGKKGKKPPKCIAKPQCKANFHCPIDGGVCCHGGDFCCPQGSKCTGNGRCQQSGVQRAMAIARMKMQEEGKKQLKLEAKKRSKTEKGQKALAETKTKNIKEKRVKFNMKRKRDAIARKEAIAKAVRLKVKQHEDKLKRQHMKRRMKKEKASKKAAKRAQERRKKSEKQRKHKKNIKEKKKKREKKAKQRVKKRQERRKKKFKEKTKKEKASKRVTWKTVASRVMHVKEGRGFSSSTVSSSKGSATTLSLWIRVEGTMEKDCSILRHGDQANRDTSSPAITMPRDTKRLHIVSSVKGDKKYGTTTPDLPMFKWQHLAIRHKPGRFVVAVNGKHVVDQSSPPPLAAHGKLWLSARGMRACAVSVADVKFAGKWVINSVLSKYRKAYKKRAKRLPGYLSKPKIITINGDRNGYQPKRATKLPARHLPTSYAFTVMMWIRQRDIIPNWGSIFHRGARDMERSPGIWTRPRSSRIYFCVSTGHHPDNCLNSPAMKLNQWYHLACSVESGKMTISFNGKVVAHRGLRGSPKFSVNGPNWSGDPWYSAFAGDVAKLQWIDQGPKYVTSRFLSHIYRKAAFPKPKSLMIMRAKTKAFTPKKSYEVREVKGRIRTSPAYTTMMWLYLHGKVSGWTSIFHRGSTNHKRMPAFFQSPHGTEIYMCVTSQRSWNNCVKTPPLQLNRWYHLAVTASASRVTGYLNGDEIDHRVLHNDRIISPGSMPVWLGDPWYRAVPGEVSRVEWVDDAVDKAFIKNVVKQKQHPTTMAPHVETVIAATDHGFRLQRAHVAMKGEDIPKAFSYSVMFWLKLDGAQPGWQNIFHKGTSDRERLPAIFVHPSDTGIHMCASSRSNWNNCINSSPLKPQKWYHIAFTVDSDGIRGFINGRQFAKGTLSGGEVRINKKAPIYVSNPWYTEAHATVADVKYITSGHSLVNSAFLKAVYDQKMHPP